MQPQQVIAPLQGVAAEAEQLQPAAAGDKDALRLRAGVVQPFEEVPPAAVFVQLVEYPQVGGGQLPTQDALPMGGDVPVQIAGGGARQTPRQGRLADLAGARHEHHLACEVADHLSFKVTGCRLHGPKIRLISTQGKIAREQFAPKLPSHPSLVSA